MITLKQLQWSNCFSYAENNSIDLDKNSITQLIGANGAGKTSIPLLLQEVLYGKNIKGIKKQDISNRHTDKNGYSIELHFSKDEEDYRVVLDRKSSLKLKLFKDGQDISSHTSINTYKTLIDIIGIDDFKTFVQLIYQSSTESLEFLTATDTNRKKFLISLLNLEKYVELHELFKKRAKELSDTIKEINGSVNNIRSWIEKHERMDKSEREELEIPSLDSSWIDDLANLKHKLSDIKDQNRKINSNNEYKRLLKELDIDLLYKDLPEFNPKDLKEAQNEKAKISGNIVAPRSMIGKLEKLSDKCPTCLQDIDEQHTASLLEQYRKEIDELQNLDKSLSEKIRDLQQIEKEHKKKDRVQSEFERLNILVDSGIPSTPYNKENLEIEIQKLSEKITEINKEISRISKHNATVSAHNSKVTVILEQLVDFREQLESYLDSLRDTENLHTIVELLKTSFSTNGLISYKIESSVKELEKVINEYLSELSQFQVYFKLSGDKLNIEVLDDAGNITGVESLSTGERGRVNIATVLAIRKIMSSLTSTRINFLFLDEIVGTIDDEGKAAICEILLGENLNTFIVSHDWTHPLISKVHIVKEGKISRIEE